MGPSRLFRSIAVLCLFLTLSLLRTSTPRLWAELASAVSEFAQAVGDLAASELGKYVSHLLETLAELERKAETESAHARADQVTMLSTTEEYMRLVNSVRASVMNRFYSIPRVDLSAHHRWQLVRRCERITWQNAYANLHRVKHAHRDERNRAQGKAAAQKAITLDNCAVVGGTTRASANARREAEI